MRSRSRRSLSNSPSWPNSWGGARHPYPITDVDGKAAERPQDFLPALKTKVLLKEQMNAKQLN
jgi:hypothetical protein